MARLTQVEVACTWHDLQGCGRHVAAVMKVVVWWSRGRVVVVVGKTGGAGRGSIRWVSVKTAAVEEALRTPARGFD
ncbi:hypothetical protein E2C01_067687 [Portunus trituberculatus]|uniref:Uncharacterized protein n=1 Tax=Portunus trituberculatus TaxID=210409 RepID=A0A5B7HKG5_PORTR|nr:hypothetical protein [Portunus trituberculatus]